MRFFASLRMTWGGGMGSYWIKLYHEVLNDPKMGRLPDRLWRRWWSFWRCEMRKETCLLAIFLAILFIGLLYGFGPTLAATPTPMKVSELTPVATVTPDSLLYIVQDPDGTPVSRQASVEAVVHAGIVPIAISGITTTVGPLIVTDTLTLESIAFSGPVTFGSASSCVDGTTIAHGLATTPTVVLLTPYSAVTATVYVKAADTVSITVGLIGAVGTADVYWLAGK